MKIFLFGDCSSLDIECIESKGGFEDYFLAIYDILLENKALSSLFERMISMIEHWNLSGEKQNWCQVLKIKKKTLSRDPVYFHLRWVNFDEIFDTN